MYPTLIKFGSVSISSFSVMVLIAFLVAYYLCEKDLIKRGEDRNIADLLLIASVVGGLGGAKLLFLYQNATISEVVQDPMRYLSSGYTFLGGLIGAILLIYIVSVYKKVSFFHLTDISAAPLILAYGIGRIGCLLVGDDYGVPTNLPWAVSFPNGAPPTIQKVHPTQVYDAICMFIIFYFLWKLKDKGHPTGWLTSVTFIVLGTQRFIVEFIRTTTPSFIDGLSQAQLISLVLIFLGIIIMVIVSSKNKYKAVQVN
ncbi:MAG: prolipoprotein diacylglyceryl transferase [Thermodesulfobacteriota bacterium]